MNTIDAIAFYYISKSLKTVNAQKCDNNKEKKQVVNKKNKRDVGDVENVVLHRQ